MKKLYLYVEGLEQQALDYYRKKLKETGEEELKRVVKEMERKIKWSLFIST